MAKAKVKRKKRMKRTAAARSRSAQPFDDLEAAEVVDDARDAFDKVISDAMRRMHVPAKTRAAVENWYESELNDLTVAAEDALASIRKKF